MFVKTAPDIPRDKPVPPHGDCSTGNAAPGIDSIIAGFQVVRTGVAVAADDSTYADSPISRDADIGLGVAFTALFLSSAIYGVTNTGQCSDLKKRSYEDTRPPAVGAAPPRATAVIGPPAAAAAKHAFGAGKKTTNDVAFRVKVQQEIRQAVQPK